MKNEKKEKVGDMGKRRSYKRELVLVAVTLFLFVHLQGEKTMSQPPSQTPPNIIISINLEKDVIVEGDSTGLNVDMIFEDSVNNVKLVLMLPEGLETPSPVMELGDIDAMTSITSISEPFFRIKGVAAGIHTITVILTENDIELVRVSTILEVTPVRSTETSPEPQETTTKESEFFESPFTYGLTPTSLSEPVFIPGFGILVTLVALPVLSWLHKRPR